MNTASLLKIGELAKATGLSSDTIRFYESKGLLAPSHRTESGYRQFSSTDVQRLQFIQRAKSVGFTLDEIGELLALKLQPQGHTCEEVKQRTEQKLVTVNEKISELMRIRASLEMLSAACEGGNESAKNCTILRLLDSSESL